MNAVLTIFKVVGVVAQSIFWDIFWFGACVAIVISLSIFGLGFLVVKLFSIIPPPPWF